MRITRSDNERLVITHFPPFLAVLGLAPALFALFVVCGTVTGQIPVAKGQPAWSLPVFFALFALVWGAVFSCFVKKLTFDFDLVHRQLTWSRRSIYGKTQGGIPLDEIRGATVDTSWRSNGGPVYRPVLSTSHGMFPLLNYSTGGIFAKGKYERLAAAINTALKANPASAMEDEICELVAQGGKQWLAAIDLARQRYGYDLAQARQFVDGLTKRLSSDGEQPANPRPRSPEDSNAQ